MNDERLGRKKLNCLKNKNTKNTHKVCKRMMDGMISCLASKCWSIYILGFQIFLMQFPLVFVQD